MLTFRGVKIIPQIRMFRGDESHQFGCLKKITKSNELENSISQDWVYKVGPRTDRYKWSEMGGGPFSMA